MDVFILTRREMEDLVWESVKFYRTGAHQEAEVLPKNKARTFKRAVVSKFLASTEDVAIKHVE